MNLKILILVNLLVQSLIGCGVEVGNPQKPGKPTPAPEVVVDHEEDAALVVGQIEQLFDTSADVDNEIEIGQATPALAITTSHVNSTAFNSEISLGLNESESQQSCRVDGPKFIATKSRNGVISRQMPHSKPRFLLEARRTFSSLATIEVDNPDSVTCLANKVPIIDYRLDGNIKISKTIDKSVARIVRRISDGEIAREELISRKGEFKIYIRNSAIDESRISTDVTSEYNYLSTYNGKRKDGRMLDISSNVESSKNLPTRVRKVYNTQEKKFIEHEIVSASIEAVNSQGRLLVTKVKNLVVDLTDDCKPKSGSIESTLFSDFEGKGQILGSYTVTISEGETSVKYSDGKEEIRAFNGCSD